MKVRITLDVTDAQRRAIACRLAGKPVKRHATRKDVESVVHAALADYVADASEAHHELTEGPLAGVKLPRAQQVAVDYFTTVRGYQVVSARWAGTDAVELRCGTKRAVVYPSGNAEALPHATDE